MNELRLTCRLLRGGGPAGLARLVLTVVGVGLGTLVALLVLVLPGVLAARGAVTMAREPVPVMADASGSDTGVPPGTRFLYAIAQGAWGKRSFGRVLVSADAGIRPPLPPGVDRWPLAGEVVLSPAARAMAVANPEFARLVPGQVVGTVGAAGLTGPDELYAYVGVAPADLGTASPGRGWNDSGRDVAVQEQFGRVPEELALILAAPMAVYLVVCARLAAATRTRRFAALRLLGMERRSLLRVAFLESAVAGLLGALLGVGGYALANPWVGPAGLLGFTWFPATSRLSATAVTALTVGVALVAGALGARSVGRSVGRPLQARFDTAERPPRWWHTLPFAVGLAAIVALLAIGPTGHGLSASSTLVLVAALLCAVLGLVLALRPVLHGLARAGLRLARSLAVRLAARRFEHEGSGLLWHLAGLSLVVLVGCLSTSVVRGMELAAAPHNDAPQVVHLNLNEVPAAARPAVLDLPATAHWMVAHSAIGPPHPDAPAPTTAADAITRVGVSLVVADCSTLRLVTGEPLPTCTDGHRYRLRSGIGGLPPLPADAPVVFTDPADRPTVLTTPKATLYLDRPGGVPVDLAMLDTSGASPVGLPADAIVMFRLAPGIDATDRFAARLAALAPAATLQLDDLDVTGLQTFRAHRGTIRTGMTAAFLLCLAAFLVSAVSRARERRRDTVALAVLGSPRRLVRAVQWWQLLVPLACALVTAVVVGYLAGNALLLKAPAQHGWYSGSLALAVPLAAAALVLAAATGAVVVGMRPRAEDLRRE